MPITAAILSGTQQAIRAVALAPCKWSELPPHAFLQLLEDDHVFRQALFQSHARLLPPYLSRVSPEKVDRFDRRLAGWLLSHERSGTVHATHDDIAHDLLTARAVVSRVLRRFALKGWIEQKRGLVHLTAPAALTRVTTGRFSVPRFDPMVGS